jgi:acyl-CoA thioester hydrolase
VRSLQFSGWNIEICDEEIEADLFYPAAGPSARGQGQEGLPGEWASRTTVRWSDVDANGHARHTAYSDFATDARLAFLAEHGFPLGELHALRLTPVMLAERLTYRREVMLGEELSVSVAVAALSGDASRATLENRIRRADGATAAVVQIDGAWLSLETRRLAAPPDELAQVMMAAPRTEAFEVLEAK